MDFEAIEKMRRTAGLTPTRMCALAGVPGYNYWRARRGTVTPSADTLAKWSAGIERFRYGVGPPLEAAPRKMVDLQVLIASGYRGYLSFLAEKFGYDALDVALRPGARRYWKPRALAIYLSSVEHNVPGSELGRSLKISKQVVSWSLKQARGLLDDPVICRWAADAQRAITARQDDDPYLLNEARGVVDDGDY